VQRALHPIGSALLGAPRAREKNVQQGGKRHDGRNGEQDESVPPWADALEVGDTPPVIALALPVLRQIGQSNASDHWADSAQGDEDRYGRFIELES